MISRLPGRCVDDLDTADHIPQAHESLIRGRDMICPGCREWSDILAFRPLREIAFFKHSTTPIYSCPKCHHKFAPVERSIEEIMRDAVFGDKEQTIAS